MSFLGHLFHTSRPPAVPPALSGPEQADAEPVRVAGEFCAATDHDHGIIDSSRHVSSIGQR